MESLKIIVPKFFGMSFIGISQETTFLNADGFFSIGTQSNRTASIYLVDMVNAIYGLYYDIPDFRVYQPTSKELDRYLGVYSSVSFPVKLSVTKSGKQLFVQTPGDAKMSMDATAKGEFKCQPAGIVIKFFPGKREMAVAQGGRTHILIKE